MPVVICKGESISRSASSKGGQGLLEIRSMSSLNLLQQVIDIAIVGVKRAAVDARPLAKLGYGNALNGFSSSRLVKACRMSAFVSRVRRSFSSSFKIGSPFRQNKALPDLCFHYNMEKGKSAMRHLPPLYQRRGSAILSLQFKFCGKAAAAMVKEEERIYKALCSALGTQSWWRLSARPTI